MYLTQWIDAHARIRPDAIALVDVDAGRRISYAELRRRSVGVAAWLATQGVEPGDRVTMLSANCPEMLETMFACARLGCIFVPLNTRLAPPELERILADCRPRLSLCEPSLGEGPWVETRDSEPPKVDVEPDQPVLILYTGGTTGVPKGAMLTAKSIQWNAWNTIAGWGLRPTDVAPIFTPFFHTGGLNVLTTPLLCIGGTVVLPSRGSFDAPAALKLVKDHDCSLFFLVPTMYQKLLECDIAPLRQVRMLVSGGAPCPEALLGAYAAEGLTIVQGYGLTEAGPNNFSGGTGGYVGVPLPHVQLRLQAADGRLAACGEVGELLIRGPHVMHGYWQRAESPVRDGWLYTGDLAVCEPDGRFRICGRSKEMFISGGENVFPAEIESVLSQHPEVAEVAVVGVADEYWGEVGRAYIVLRSPVTHAELKAFCRAHLAAYKTPREFVTRDALPKSPVGKILKHLLADA